MSEKAKGDSTTPKASSPSGPAPRAKQACIPCRQAKRRCHGTYPKPCPYCYRQGRDCYWPDYNGRRQKRKRMEGEAEVEQNPAVVTGRANPEVVDQQAAERVHTQHVTGTALQSTTLNQGSAPLSLPQDIPAWTTRQYDPTISGDNIMDTNTWESFLNDIGFDATRAGEPSSARSAVSASVPEQGIDGLLEILGLSQMTNGGWNNDDTDGDGSRPALDVVEIRWIRPYGRTSMTHGRQQYTLKLQAPPPQHTSGTQQPQSPISPRQQDRSTLNPIIQEDGMPREDLMRHLITVFVESFGDQFPLLTQKTLTRALENRSGSVFLCLSVACIAARFSTHPELVLQGLKPHEYGKPFMTRARSMLGEMLKFPSRKTIAALTLLTYSAFGDGMPSEVWLLKTLAVNMATDLGVHLDPRTNPYTNGTEDALDRAVLWPAVLLDVAISFEVGRKTSFDLDKITQTKLTLADLELVEEATVERSPWPLLCQQTALIGQLINVLNVAEVETSTGICKSLEGPARTSATSMYDEIVAQHICLPVEMQWSNTTLKTHVKNGSACSFLQLHLWANSIVASASLFGLDEDNANSERIGQAQGSFNMTAIRPNVTESSSTEMIGQILRMSDAVSPCSWLSSPIPGIAYYFAGRRMHLAPSAAASTAYDAMFFYRALEKLSAGWYGATLWLQGLKQVIYESAEVDMRKATKQMDVLISVPEQDLFRRFQAVPMGRLM